MTCRLRVAAPEDLETLLPLLRAQLEEHGEAIPSDTLARALRVLLAEPLRGSVLIAEERASAIGLAVLATTWTLERGGLTAWLDELYVVPEKRGAGTGGALLDQAIIVARAMGALALEVEVARDHSRAESLYQQRGFAPLHRNRFALSLGT